ncbi:glycosyltransferase [Iocasia frigidifontis]|uniref:Glycosyltransferase n=1 Tax=Iocasia fonsfrigidae TaxID=2682810 RepID=A0A8A7KIJ4_9FIRM|nr:glycosyltransferase [Iocasia fonsfrigidae]QTL97692.1 glycosyltransferase [Iocasia fonsfrigidae]
MKLSIGMMVKNESKYLEECLKSLEPIRAAIDSELVIVDTGSEDNTVEIAKKYTDRVYFHQWNNNFSEIRNIVIAYAWGKWLFVIDGDEVVEDPEPIIDFFKSGQEKKYYSVYLKIKNYSNLEENQFTLFTAPRLFRNDGEFHYEGVVHNQPVFKIPICITLNTTIKHYGYLLTNMENIKNKYKRTSTILRLELEKEPENIYYWFQLSKCYDMCKEHSKAFETIKKAYDIANKKNIKLDNKMYVYIQLAKTQVLTNKYRDAEKTCQKALQVKDGYVDLYYYLALSQFRLGKNEESLENFLKYINLVINFEKSAGYLDTAIDNETVSLINGVYSYVIVLCERLNKYTETLEFIDKIETEKDIEKVLDKIIKIYLELEEYDKLKNYYDTKIKSSDLRAKFLTFLEKYQSESGDFEKYELAKAFSKEIISKSKIETEEKQKLVFFVKKGLDNFLDIVINGLSVEYETKKIIVTEVNQIEKWMEWADICWFEWCDDLAIYGSKLELAKKLKIICRLHSYEAFTNYPAQVNWDYINKLIFVAGHLQKFVVDNYKIDKEKTIVIPNGIDAGGWTFKQRKPGFNIAYVGYINYKKGPMLLLHTFKALYNMDSKYKLYIAGKFQDNRDVLYFQQMIKEFGLEKNLFFDGWQGDIDKWLEDKNCILCTSVLESQNMSVMQAMSKGIKPIIHNFVGAKSIYEEKYIWNTIDEAVEMIMSEEYNSKEYRRFIQNKYSIEVQLNKIKTLL